MEHVDRRAADPIAEVVDSKALASHEGASLTRTLTIVRDELSVRPDSRTRWVHLAAMAQTARER